MPPKTYCPYFEIERIVKRDKVSEEEAKIIIDKQMSRHDRISYATDFILNDSSIEDFERKLEFYFNFFESQNWDIYICLIEINVAFNY